MKTLRTASLISFIACLTLSISSCNQTTQTPQLAGLKIEFNNNTGLPDSNVYLTVQNPKLGYHSFYMTYVKKGKGDTTFVNFDDPTDLMSTSIALSDIDQSSIYVDSVISGIFFVSYGNKLTSKKSAPSYIGKGEKDYYTPFQNFELTRVGNPGDQGDMTAINFFTAPMAITSYSKTGDTLQSKEYNLSVDAIRDQLTALTNNNPNAVILSKDSTTYIRIIGPSSYSKGQTNPYPSFVSYLNSIQSAKDTTIIKNHNAFVDTAKKPSNYDFRLNFKATVNSTSIFLTGKIEVYKTLFGKSPALDTTFDHISLTINSPADSTSLLDLVIYGQSIADNVTFSPTWNNISNYMDSVNLSNPKAYSITKNLAVGEITTGILLGLINSDSLSPSGDTLKNIASQDWWTMNPMKAFSDVQNNPSYYNQYANVIYKASNNQVYSIPYSDRLGNGPLVNSVNFNGTPVSKWVIRLDPPLGAVNK